MKFVDSAKVYLSSGKGGNGIVGWRREKFIEFGGPDGGNGGNGGNIYVKGSKGLYSLYDLKLNPHQSAKNGGHGSSRKKKGANGLDLTIKLPLGTLVKDEATNEILAEVLDEKPILLLKGGHGGLGNAHFKTSTRQAPEIATAGGPALKLTAILDLLVMADVGLVGLPNAGKSTFISAISNAKPEVAAYPFTTLTPHLGVVNLADYKSFVMADIPGLIKGASQGLGLGIKFLRHIERTKILAFLIDVSDEADHDPIEALTILNNELLSYNENLINKPKFIILTKLDSLKSTKRKNKITSYFKENNLDFLFISAINQIGLNEAIEGLFKKLSLAQAQQ